jgi:hypothetical protein
MPTPHRATPDEWAAVDLHADPDAYCYRDSCILELHYRVEALEAAQQQAATGKQTSQVATAPEAAPVATDGQLLRAWHSVPDFELGPTLRTVYDLGFKHAAQPTPPPAPAEPAPAGGRIVGDDLRPPAPVPFTAPSTQRAQRLLDELEKGGLPAVLRHLAGTWGDPTVVHYGLLQALAAELEGQEVWR